MSILIAPVPETAPIHVPSIVMALRQQIRSGAGDAVLIRISGSAAEYRRLAHEFGLRPLAVREAVSGPKPAIAARAAPSPRERKSCGDGESRPIPALPDSNRTDESRATAVAEQSPSSSKALPEARGASCAERPAGVAPGPQDASPAEGGGSPGRKRRKPKPAGDEAALLRDIARVRRRLAALERRWS